MCVCGSENRLIGTPYLLTQGLHAWAGMTGPKKLGTMRCTPASLAAVVRASCSVMTCARTQEMTTSVPRRRSTISAVRSGGEVDADDAGPAGLEAGYILLVEGGGTDEGRKFPGR